MRHIVEPLRAAGITVLRFDFTGPGASAGDFSDTRCSSNVSDLLAAAAHMSTLSETHNGTPTLLIGHSPGGTAVLQAAQVKHLLNPLTNGSCCSTMRTARTASMRKRG